MEIYGSNHNTNKRTPPGLEGDSSGDRHKRSRHSGHLPAVLWEAKRVTAANCPACGLLAMVIAASERAAAANQRHCVLLAMVIAPTALEQGWSARIARHCHCHCHCHCRCRCRRHCRVPWCFSRLQSSWPWYFASAASQSLQEENRAAVLGPRPGAASEPGTLAAGWHR